jgi:hypothetical protein
MSTVWTSADLKAVAFGGEIAEDVLRRVFDISKIPLPIQDRVGSSSASNEYHEWLTDRLSDPDVDNARVDGSDPSANNAKGGARVGNHCQISSKTVKVSTRAQNSDVFTGNDLSRQVMRRNQELRRDVDAIVLEPQASLADVANTTAGRLGGLPSWLVTNTYRGAGGADGGFSTGIAAAPTPGTARGLTETLIKQAASDVWKLGGDPSVIMSVPDVIASLSTYMFTSSARIATLQSDQGVKGQTAVGYVNYFLTDFDVQLEMVGNRLQQLHDDATPVTPVPVADVFILTPAMLNIAFLHGYRMDALAKTGLSDERDMTVDYTLEVNNEEAHAVIADVDPTIAVVA